MAYNPGCVLKRISHNEILENYLKGQFSNIVCDKTIKVSSQTTIVCEEFSNDPNSGIFRCTLSKYGHSVYVSSNQNAFDTFAIDGSRPKGLDCDWCHDQFDNESTGIVVAYTKTFYTDPDSQESHLYEIFWIYGNHCSPECAIGELVYNHRINPSNMDCNSAITYTKLLFTKSTGKPVEELIPTPYYRLLKSRGGMIEKSDTHKYVQSNNIIMAPAKMIFEQLKY